MAASTMFPADKAYGEFLAELDEIQRLKWLRSEKAGKDVGFEFALNEWAQDHRSEWRRMRDEARRMESNSSQLPPKSQKT